MSPKNRKVHDAAGDGIAEDDASEEDSFEDDADDESFDADNQDEDDYEDDADDSGDELDDEPPARETPAEKRKRMDKVRASTMAAEIEPGRSSVSTKWAIDRLDAREKRFSFIAAGGAAVFGVAIYLYQKNDHNFHPAKGQLSSLTILIIGLVAAVLLFGTTMLGRRAPVGFVGLFTGAALGGSYLFLGLPFFVLAIWLLYRSYKLQKETTARLREAGVGPRARTSAAARPAKAARPAASSRPTTVAEARRARSKRSSAPVGNKRYTPKRPTPPPPKPSRRQRKAAATD